MARAAIAIVGTGRLGLAVCARLVQRGHPVVAHDRRAERSGPVTAVGARWATSLGETVEGCELLITVLPGARELIAAHRTLVASLAPGSTWIDLTTGSPEAAAAIAAAAATRGVHVLDAPVGGNPEAARRGELLAFVGAASADLRRHRELLSQLATTVVHAGDHGAGYAMKLLVNMLWFGQAVAGAEALALGERAGLRPEAIRDAVARSAAANRFMDRDAPALLAGDDMASFPLQRCLEQLTTVSTMGRRLGVPLALGDRVRELYAEARERHGDVDGELLAARLVLERARRRPRG